MSKNKIIEWTPDQSITILHQIIIDLEERYAQENADTASSQSFEDYFNIEWSSLPSAAIPDDACINGLWAMDNEGNCLCGEGGVICGSTNHWLEIKHIDYFRRGIDPSKGLIK